METNYLGHRSEARLMPAFPSSPGVLSLEYLHWVRWKETARPVPIDSPLCNGSRNSPSVILHTYLSSATWFYTACHLFSPVSAFLRLFFLSVEAFPWLPERITQLLFEEMAEEWLREKCVLMVPVPAGCLDPGALKKNQSTFSFSREKKGLKPQDP